MNAYNLRARVAQFTTAVNAMFSAACSPNTASVHVFKRMYGGAASAVCSAIAVAIVSTAFSACNLLSDPHDDHSTDHSDDHSIVTTVRMSLTTVGMNDTTDYTWEDIDGIGGNNPNRIDTVFLEAGKQYSGMLSLTNRAKNPAEDITAEIRKDADEHQIFYTLSNNLGTVSVTDSDGRALPLGLTFTVRMEAGRAGLAGTMKVALYHYENISDKNGTDPSNETDVELNFPVVVR